MLNLGNLAIDEGTPRVVHSNFVTDADAETETILGGANWLFHGRRVLRLAGKAAAKGGEKLADARVET